MRESLVLWEATFATVRFELLGLHVDKFTAKHKYFTVVFTKIALLLWGKVRLLTKQIF